MNKEVIFSSKSEMWETPQQFFDMLDYEFCFELDACAVKENAKCKNFYSPEQMALNSLGQDMFGAIHLTEET